MILRKWGGGGQRPFRIFPKIHSFWYRHPSLSSVSSVHLCTSGRSAVMSVGGVPRNKPRFLNHIVPFDTRICNLIVEVFFCKLNLLSLLSMFSEDEEFLLAVENWLFENGSVRFVCDHKTNRKSIWWSGEIHRNTSCVIHQIGFASALLTIIILPFLIEVSKLTITYFDHFARNISFTAVSRHLIVIKTNLKRTSAVATNAKKGFKIDHLVIHKHRSTIWTDL